MRPRKEDIRRTLIHFISIKTKSPVSDVSDIFKISRQAVNRHLQELIKEGLVLATGNTRNREYTIPPIGETEFFLPLDPKLEEDIIWSERIRPVIGDIPANVLHICNYGFTEMMNNVIDHSEGDMVFVSFCYSAALVEMRVADDGIGIFEKLKRDLNLEDKRHAILELTKGRVTTDPKRHSGEGIFFTSRMFDYFSIASGDLFFSHMAKDSDWLIEGSDAPIPGTMIYMNIDINSKTSASAVFRQYAAKDDKFGFSRTHIPVSVAHYGEDNLISRSQAKRLLTRVDRFKEVHLDFSNVGMIGQAFADEIFRVFQNEHPDVHITWTNANEDVLMMIGRAVERREEESNS